MTSNLLKKRKELSISQLPSSRLSSSRVQDTIRVLVEHGSYDPLDQSRTDFDHFTIEEHNDLAWSLADQYGESSAELLLLALNNGLKPNMIDPFKPAWNRYRSSTLLHIEAQRLDRYVHAGYSLDSSLQVIRKYNRFQSVSGILVQGSLITLITYIFTTTQSNLSIFI